jgi:hypothetical protein
VHESGECGGLATLVRASASSASGRCRPPIRCMHLPIRETAEAPLFRSYSLTTKYPRVPNANSWFDAPEIELRHPLRLVRPGYSVYVVPREEGKWVVGATGIESDDRSAARS